MFIKETAIPMAMQIKSILTLLTIRHFALLMLEFGLFRFLHVLVNASLFANHHCTLILSKHMLSRYQHCGY